MEMSVTLPWTLDEWAFAKKREGKRELRFHGQFDIRPFDKTNDYMRDISSIHTRTLLVHREMGND